MRLIGAFITCELLIASSPLLAQDSITAADGTSEQTIAVRAVGTVRVSPDTAYVMMKVETQAALLGQAIDQNRKAVSAFVDALCRSGIDRSSIRETNFIVSGSLMGTGASFSRNVIITIPEIGGMGPGEFSRLMAKVQDLGARFGSSCVTCIGSG